MYMKTREGIIFHLQNQEKVNNNNNNNNKKKRPTTLSFASKGLSLAEHS